MLGRNFAVFVSVNHLSFLSSISICNFIWTVGRGALEVKGGRNPAASALRPLSLGHHRTLLLSFTEGTHCDPWSEGQTLWRNSHSHPFSDKPGAEVSFTLPGVPIKESQNSDGYY